MKPRLLIALGLGWLFLPVPFLIHSSLNQTTAIRFANMASAAGIQPELRCGGPEKKWIPEANGTGAAWLDYDNDGRLDLLIVNGSTLERLRQIVSGKAIPPQKDGVFLYRNLGNGRFQDVTVEAHLANAYWGTGANAVDYDNDGLTETAHSQKSARLLG
jgi:enediyne biosynthesis protein E4